MAGALARAVGDTMREITSTVPATKSRRRKASRVTNVVPSAPLVASIVAPDLCVLPLGSVLPSVHNPRTDATSDLDGLATSMATEHEPYLLQPPVVEQYANSYRIVSGERRVRGAALAGWNTIACLVRPALDPVLTHTMRIVENLHRADLHSLDAATALKIAWLCENGLALGAGEAVTDLLARELPPAATLAALAEVASDAGFVPSHPAITWEALLGRLGLALNRERLKKLLRVLNLHPAVLETVRPLELSEAALRALGTLNEADQQQLAAALRDDPLLGAKIRRIARRVKQKGYPIAKAIAEVRGQVYMPELPRSASEREMYNRASDASSNDEEDSHGGEAGGEHGHPLNHSDRSSVNTTSPTELTDIGPECADAVLRLLELAEQVTQTISTIYTTANGVAPSTLPSPWGDIVLEATTLLQTTLTDHALH